MIKLDAKYLGGDIYLDTVLDNSKFGVEATYEDGTIKTITEYSISPTESSSYINLDQEEDNSNNNQTKSFLLSQLSECSKTDETSTLCGSSSSD